MADLRDLTAIDPRAVRDEDFYQQVRSARRQRKEEKIVSPGAGCAFVVEKGQIFRLMQQVAPQVGEISFWNANNPKERFSPMRNRLFEGLFVTRDTRLWSDVPRLRPMTTCLEDTLSNKKRPSLFHYHRFWTHCSAQSMEMRFGQAGLPSCYANLSTAIEPFGLTSHDLQGNIVVFQKVRFDTSSGKWFVAVNDVTEDDYLEFYAEIDLLVGVSVCPNASSSLDQPLHPLGVEIYETGIAPKPFPRWTDWRPGWTGRWVAPPQTDS